MCFKVIHADCIAAMRGMDDNSIDSICTDPPYELGFMGKKWDRTGIASGLEVWSEALRVLKPGAHLLAFGGARTYHRMVCAIEDAGFEVRDQIMWLYGSGFPKSLDVSKAIDNAAGVDREVVGERPWSNAKMDAGNGISGLRQSGGYAGDYESDRVRVPLTAPATEAAKRWEGWGTALKPAHEPIVVARKPLIGTVAANVLRFGTGAINVDACRVPGAPRTTHTDGNRIGNRDNATSIVLGAEGVTYAGASGRWPANLIHDGSDEVLAAFPLTTSGNLNRVGGSGDGYGFKGRDGIAHRGDTGSAARFFYCAKASKSDRGAGNTHPTVKPVALCAYLQRLVTPSGGTTLDPFAGSGSFGVAAMREGFHYIGIENDIAFVHLARARIASEIDDGLSEGLRHGDGLDL